MQSDHRKLASFAGLHDRYELQLPGQQLSLCVVGIPAVIHEVQDALEDALVPHAADSQVQMDRFDARHMLDSLRWWDEQRWLTTPLASSDVDAGTTAAELEAERYRDLDYSREYQLESPVAVGIALHAGFSGGDEQQEPDPTGTAGSSQAPHAHTGPAFAFDYSQQSAKQQQTDLDGTAAQLPLQGSQAAAYLPPFSGIPPHLADHLPDNEKIHKIIAQTAKFVRSNGKQVELVLRVKHGSNANFAFLVPSSRLFPYYRWLLEADPVEEPFPPSALASQQPGVDRATLLTTADQAQQLAQQQQTSPAPSPPASSDAADGDGEPGALELLRAYSMASEMDSEQGDVASSTLQGPATAATSAAEPVMYGPNLPPSAAAREASPAAAYGPELPPADLTGQGRDDDGPGLSCKATPAQAAAAAAATDACNSTAAADGGTALAERDTTASSAAAEALHAMSAASGGTAGLTADPAAAASCGDDTEPPPPGTEVAEVTAAGLEAAVDAAVDSEALPPQLAGVMDKLVAFVAKNGVKFEAVVRGRERGNPRFSFLHPWSPYHKYYRQRLQHALGTEAVETLFGKHPPPATAAASPTAVGQAVGAAEATSESGLAAATVATESSSSLLAAMTAGAAAAGAMVASSAVKPVLLKANPSLLAKLRGGAGGAAAPACGPPGEADQAGATPPPDDLPAMTAEAADDSGTQQAARIDHARAAEVQHPLEDPGQPVVNATGPDSAGSPGSAGGCGVDGAVQAAAEPAHSAVAGAEDPAAVLAARRLKLQTYLRQKRAEQLAEQQQREHEQKAHAIFAHRLLLKKLEAGEEAEEGSGTPAAISPGAAGTLPAAAGGAAGPAVQQQEIEEGEIMQEPEEQLDTLEVIKLLQPELASQQKQQHQPVLTMLPGLKQLAGSAVAAAAMHRAALLKDDSDGEEADADDMRQHAAQLSRSALAATSTPAALGAAAIPVGPAQQATSASAGAASRNLAVAMASAANAAAASFAAQLAAGTPAPQAASTAAPHQPDTDVSAAIAAAATAAAAAAAAAATTSKKDRTVASSKPEQSDDEALGDADDLRSASSNDSSSSSSSGGSPLPSSAPKAHHCRGHKASKQSPALPGTDGGSSKRSTSQSRLRRSRHRDRSRSRSRTRDRSRGNNPKRHKSSKQHSSRRHREGDQHRHSKRRKSSRSRTRDGGRQQAEKRQRSSRDHKELHKQRGNGSKKRKHHRSTGHERDSSTSSGSRSRSKSDVSTPIDLLAQSAKQQQAKAVQLAEDAGVVVPVSTAAAVAPAADAAAGGAAAATVGAAGLPAVHVNVDSDRLRQRLRAMLGKLQQP